MSHVFTSNEARHLFESAYASDMVIAPYDRNVVVKGDAAGLAKFFLCLVRDQDPNEDRCIIDLADDLARSVRQTWSMGGVTDYEFEGFEMEHAHADELLGEYECMS